ncbi:multiple monosaccharide ABC transporter ATP-binding protein [Brachybacterium sp. YJGR34]|uniref:multiple monosaccharide ABC transporter ATP-binding protein n=1 Tax=Brachybacterium sp. YJGR34 TaxID=2059911 RepID=UPI000E0BDECF|nr:multiple monosaccharide ABC transporter ATP-binding protein [Brachybacterium sp. YJGR34]
MHDDILEMRSITKRFPGVTALKDVSLRVREGEIHAICGENGAGKSTLMKVLSGVEPAGTYEGEIHFRGRPMSFATVNDSEAEGIVIIHQELALVPYLSVAENIFLGNERSRAGIISWHETNARAAELLARVGLDENPVTPVDHLGVGKQQLVEIAKALSKDVSLLILDEPTAALNDDDSEHLLGLIRGLRDEGVTCIIISHKLGEIVEVADSTTIIRDGSTIETIDMHVPEPERPALIPRLIRGMVGRDIEHLYPERDAEIGEEILRIEDWHVGHPTQQDRVVVDGASLHVRAGEVVGIAGLMGAGRTELARSVFGRSYGRDITGTVSMHGKPVQLRSVAEAIAHGLAYVSEDRKQYGLNLIQDIRTNVTAAALRKVTTGPWIDGNEEIAVAERYRSSLNIKTPTVMSLVGKLSGGNQQKVVLSKWLFTEPEVLILDEPTRGVDVGAKFEIYSIINELAEAGKAIIVISSELPEVMGLADRIYTLSVGRITGEVPARDATQERLMELMTRERE